jgi:hypothetical protein
VRSPRSRPPRSTADGRARTSGVEELRRRRPTVDLDSAPEAALVADCAAAHIHADLGLHASIDDLLSKPARNRAARPARARNDYLAFIRRNPFGSAGN